MLHRVREACGRGGAFKLSGVVEVDETDIGGKEKNKLADRKFNVGRGTAGGIPVVGLLERGGQFKAMPVGSTDKATLRSLITENIEAGSTIYTEEHDGNAGLEGFEFKHESVKHSVKEYVKGMCHINGVESVWGLWKRFIHGTWTPFSPKHLRRNVNEASFRLNQGKCNVDIIDRIRALTLRLVMDGRLPLNTLTVNNGLSNKVEAAA